MREVEDKFPLLLLTGMNDEFCSAADTSRSYHFSLQLHSSVHVSNMDGGGRRHNTKFNNYDDDDSLIG
ncbi:hypothetical protein TSUD_206420 [Trifolium subterraneum]|uniref:Uncharacterized protein n=1 Tax=Trifolium subterraneum TaxID=3900 RepID=A0A2Z6MTS5_TRISU|nr:hypothetical protein TSUD_206420 [Trifolium subterraneum]